MKFTEQSSSIKRVAHTLAYLWKSRSFVVKRKQRACSPLHLEYFPWGVSRALGETESEQSLDPEDDCFDAVPESIDTELKSFAKCSFVCEAGDNQETPADIGDSGTMKSSLSNSPEEVRLIIIIKDLKTESSF